MNSSHVTLLIVHTLFSLRESKKENQNLSALGNQGRVLSWRAQCITWQKIGKGWISDPSRSLDKHQAEDLWSQWMCDQRSLVSRSRVDLLSDWYMRICDPIWSISSSLWSDPEIHFGIHQDSDDTYSSFQGRRNMKGGVGSCPHPTPRFRQSAPFISLEEVNLLENPVGFASRGA